MKQIHPNINPMVADSEELQSLWQRTVIAYNWNDLRLLEELEVLVDKALETRCSEYNHKKRKAYVAGVCRRFD